jgi:hypothetical protein
LGRAGFGVTGPNEQKFFRRFFQKNGCFLVGMNVACSDIEVKPLATF